MRLYVPIANVENPQLEKTVIADFSRTEFATLDTYAGIGAAAIMLEVGPEEHENLRAAQTMLVNARTIRDIRPEYHGENSLYMNMPEVEFFRRLMFKGAWHDCIIKRMRLTDMDADIIPTTVRSIYHGLDVARSFTYLSPNEAKQNFSRFNVYPGDPLLRTGTNNASKNLRP